MSRPHTMSDSSRGSGQRMGGALWASHDQAPGHSRRTMVLAIIGALMVEGLIVFGVSHIKAEPPPPPPRTMRITMPPPPPPPPPPEVKKLEPPPAPKPLTPKPPPPKPPPKAPPAKPAPVPKPAVIPAAPHPAAQAPALATAPADAAPAAPTVAAAPPAPAAPAAPPAPPALHGVVDGRGHCQSVQPTIPKAALQRGISSDVTAHLTINPDGSVGDVTIVRASPPTTVFNEAVIAAAKAYKCQKNATSYVGEVVFSFKTTSGSDDDQ
ncbi:TonB family protein [Robbsia sp. KACC 23696]|uniref:TonB family protein n=1 Tax=Robbsia sp. KACC 23696 TaxID=3149231 RepID=UPI00325AE821